MTIVLPEHTMFLWASSRHATDIPAVLSGGDGQERCLRRRKPQYKAAAESNQFRGTFSRMREVWCCVCARACHTQRAFPQGPQRRTEINTCWASTAATYFTTAQESHPMPSYAGCGRGNWCCLPGRFCPPGSPL